MRICQTRFQADGLPVFLGCSFSLPLSKQDVTKIIVRLRFLWVESYRLTQLSNCLIVGLS